MAFFAELRTAKSAEEQSYVSAYFIPSIRTVQRPPTNSGRKCSTIMTGKIEQAITRAIHEKQRRGMKVVVCTADMVFEVYGNSEPTRPQQIVVQRAMQLFVQRHRAFVLASGQGGSRLSIIKANDTVNRQLSHARPAAASPIETSHPAGR